MWANNRKHSHANTKEQRFANRHGSYIRINEYWDRISKVIILIVDAALNWWFLKIVKDRLVKHHGLTKYAPLVTFNGRLMILSISMDVSFSPDITKT
jgi:hypothetical protein